ncbi:MAG: hypothetical protein VYE68_00820 [Acidobacteriota bacterium]|nr:hypothetical protein [Acidobacteriota bacterium]
MPSTQILAGAAIDRECGASVLNLEASGGVGVNRTLEVDPRGFVNVPLR